MIKLGILDYAQINEGQSPEDAIQETIQLAVLAEQLGFERFWVAEHHNVPAFASSSPEILMMALLSQTKQIRIGSGGVMLPHYAPLKVAENFKLMSTIYPGRVDFGFGNSPGTTFVQRAMGSKSKQQFDYLGSVKQIQSYLQNEADNHQVYANPLISHLPQMCALSSSIQSAKMAAELGIGYTFGIFPFASTDKLEVGKRACQYYRDHFQPSAYLDKPYVSVAPFVCIAEHEELAKDYLKALDVWLLGKKNFSEFDTFPSVLTANNYNYTGNDRENIAHNRTRIIAGDAASVKDQLGQVVFELGAQEALLIPLMPTFQAKSQALTLLSESFHLASYENRD